MSSVVTTGWGTKLWWLVERERFVGTKVADEDGISPQGQYIFLRICVYDVLIHYL